MSFTKLVGNERIKEVLKRLLRQGRVGSTLIFAGPDGIGKRQFALTMAKAVNCQGAAVTDGFRLDSCDECPVCRRIEAGSYGDVKIIQPDGASIKIAQTRALIAEAYFRPQEGRQRFFIIDEADRLHKEAANSLLKTLEEPPATSTIILLTPRPNSMLSTIRSRAQRLNFTPLPIEQMEKYLAANFPRPAPETALLARLTEGRIGQATAFDLSVYRQERRVLIEMLELMANNDSKGTRFRLMKAAEYLGKKERDEFEKELTLLNSLLRDLFLISAGKPAESIVNLDAVDKLAELAGKIGTDRLIKWVEKFDELRRNLRVNINKQIAMEAALLELAART